MKTAIESKTIIFNILSLALAGLMFVTPIVPDGNIKDLVLAVVAVINIALRFKTNTAIKGVM